ncbi:MAG: hypothetical protein HYU60_00335 [Magnetospirillum sp.]|nr:hypothetical protein [Magnetospirillum sp.]
MTAPRKPVTLDDLDRDELLQLIRGGLPRGFGYSERDLVWAQWEVACRRAHEMRELEITKGVAIIPLATDLDATIRERNAAHALGDLKEMQKAAEVFERAWAAYKAASDEKDKLYAKVERFERRADRLYKLHQELSR